MAWQDAGGSPDEDSFYYMKPSMSLRRNCLWLRIDLTVCDAGLLVTSDPGRNMRFSSCNESQQGEKSTVTGVLDDRAILFIYLFNKTCLNWWLQATLDVPWLVDTSFQSLPLSSVAFPSESLCLWSVIGFRVHPNPGLSHPEILHLITSAKILSPNKLTFTGAWD